MCLSSFHRPSYSPRSKTACPTSLLTFKKLVKFSIKKNNRRRVHRCHLCLPIQKPSQDDYYYYRSLTIARLMLWLDRSQVLTDPHHCKAPPFWCTCCSQHTVTSSRTSKQIPLQATSNSSIVCHKTHCSTTASSSDVLPLLQPLDPIILAQWQPHPPTHPLPTQHSSQNSHAPLAMTTSSSSQPPPTTTSTYPFELQLPPSARVCAANIHAATNTQGEEKCKSVLLKL